MNGGAIFGLVVAAYFVVTACIYVFVPSRLFDREVINRGVREIEKGEDTIGCIALFWPVIFVLGSPIWAIILLNKFRKWWWSPRKPKPGEVGSEVFVVPYAQSKPRLNPKDDE